MRPANHNSTKSLVQVAPRVESRQILVAICEPAEPVDDNLIAFTTAEHGGFQIALYDAKKGSSEILTRGPSSLEPTWRAMAVT